MMVRPYINRTPEYLERCRLSKAYRTQKSHAKKRGIGFYLTFDEWYATWERSGKLAERGRLSNQYCMARFGDVGFYIINNVEIKTNNLNCTEGSTGRKHSDEVKFRIGCGNRGKPHPYKGIPLARWPKRKQRY
jgi:hypothetical protein